MTGDRLGPWCSYDLGVIAHADARRWDSGVGPRRGAPLTHDPTHDDTTLHYKVCVYGESVACAVVVCGSWDPLVSVGTRPSVGRGTVGVF